MVRLRVRTQPDRWSLVRTSDHSSPTAAPALELEWPERLSFFDPGLDPAFAAAGGGGGGGAGAFFGTGAASMRSAESSCQFSGTFGAGGLGGRSEYTTAFSFLALRVGAGFVMSEIALPEDNAAFFGTILCVRTSTEPACGILVKAGDWRFGSMCTLSSS